MTGLAGLVEMGGGRRGLASREEGRRTGESSFLRKLVPVKTGAGIHQYRHSTGFLFTQE